MKLARRELFSAVAGGFTLLSSGVTAQRLGTITPEEFGAEGDGKTNDTLAFAAMAAHVNRMGGGRVLLRPVTYLVGAQTRSGSVDYAFEPQAIMNFASCSGAIAIEGNGARLRCASGLRYGTFNRDSGNPTSHPTPYYRGGEVATPYHAMINVEDCRGTVDISDLELDGNLANLVIGGQFGDTGWQIPASGIRLSGNSGAERLNNVFTHHHALDGILIDGLDAPRTNRSSFQRVHCTYNGRQGCSITGGRGYDFSDCRFEHTGKSRISSAPGAGVDIEAEAGRSVSDLSFTRCVFANNTGPGMLADSGPAERASFSNCTFIGTTSWGTWPRKPGFRFSRCTFVGAIVHAYGDLNAARACHFFDCRFLDDPKLSPTGQVFGGGNPSRPIADLPNNPNVLFKRCNFNLTHDCVLPWTTNVVIFEDCVMQQRASAMSYPRGTFIGRNTINGNANLYSAKVRGELIMNGKKVPLTVEA